MKLNFHHIGIAVSSIAESAENYKALFGEQCISKIYDISSQQVKVCFVDMGNNTFIELVEATTEDSSIHRLRKKGITYYHTAYKVSDIKKTVAVLTELNYKAFEYFNSEAFNGKRCIFLFSPDAHLIELIEE